MNRINYLIDSILYSFCFDSSPLFQQDMNMCLKPEKGQERVGEWG